MSRKRNLFSWLPFWWRQFDKNRRVILVALSEGVIWNSEVILLKLYLEPIIKCLHLRSSSLKRSQGRKLISVFQERTGQVFNWRETDDVSGYHRRRALNIRGNYLSR